MFDHVVFSASDYERSKAFFLQALQPLGVELVSEGPLGIEMCRPGETASLCIRREPVAAPSHLHLAFTVSHRAQVDAFHRAALAAGGQDHGAPGLRPQYHAGYYAAFVIGPDGHNIEAVCHATTPPPEAVVREFWRLMASNDFASVAAVLAPEFVVEWPQSKERIRGPQRFCQMNTEYPTTSRWRFQINRLVASGESVVTQVSLTDGAQSAEPTSFFTVREGKIVQLVEYWPEPFAPAEHRRHLVEPMDGSSGPSAR